MFTFKRIICFWIIMQLSHWIIGSFACSDTYHSQFFSFDILGNPEQKKLEFFYIAFFVGLLNLLAWLTFNFELFSLTYEL